MDEEEPSAAHRFLRKRIKKSLWHNRDLRLKFDREHDVTCVVTRALLRLPPAEDEAQGKLKPRAEQLSFTERELDECERLSPGLVDRASERIRVIPTEANHVKPRPRLWRRKAAILVTLSVFLLAAAPIYFFWLGRNSTEELTFENAIETVFDAAVPMNRRHSAYGHIAVSIKVGISAIKKRAIADPRLRREAEVAFETIKKMRDNPASILVAEPKPSGHLEALLSTLRADDHGPVGPKIEAIRSFVQSAAFGIDTLSRGSKLGKDFRIDYKIQMDQIHERLKW